MSDMLCAIPARGGSKRLPRKNVEALAGRPMIAYTIEAARETDLFETIYVCTDDREIAAVAREYGASVPRLMSPELCGDLVASHEPCQYLAEYLADERNCQFETLVCLQPTSPLRSPTDIERGVSGFRTRECDFLVSVTEIDPHYFHWAVTEESGGSGWEMFFGERYMRERPELPPVYRPNGSVKIADLSTLAETGHFFGERLETIETPPERSIHVGTGYEFELCEHFLTNT